VSSRKCRFRVVAKLDRGVPQEGTVEIDRASGFVFVRPLRRRRTYVLTLARVAAFVVHTVVRAEVAEKRAARRRRRSR
jgi:hypothetical protein